MPIVLREFDAPKMRARAQELDTDAGAFFGGVAKVDDAAFLLFFGCGIDENQFGAKLERLVQVKQAAVRINHDGLAFRAEFPAFDVLARRVNRDSREDAGTAAFFRDLRFWHRHEYRAMGRRASQLRLRTPCPKEQSRKLLKSRDLA